MKTIKANEVKVSGSIINDLLEELKETQAGTPRYKELLENIDALTEVRERMVDTKNEIRSKGLDVNTVVSGIFGFAGLLTVLNFERADVITSKAFTMATKWLGR